MSTDDRPLVYLVHGLLESAPGHYAEQIPALRDEYRLLPVDLPGHGRCPVDAREPFYELAERYLGAVLAKFGPGHVVAASYVGSPVAVRCALRTPELVRSLVLQGFVPELDEATFTGWMAGFEHLGWLSDQHEYLAEGYERVHGVRWKDTLAAVLADTRDAYAERIVVTGAELARLAMPVLLVNGSVRTVERDAATTVSRFGQHIRGEVIADAGHLPGRQRPERFNEVLRTFWREVA